MFIIIKAGTRMDHKNKLLNEIEIARIELIGTSIVTLGHGIVTFANGLALEALEKEYISHYHGRRSIQAEPTKKQLDYFIHELTQIRNKIG